MTEPFSEKYLKKLIGRTNIEDVLKRLDRLTQEEARMAAAQILKVANTVDDRVEGIANNIISVDNRVAGVDDRVAVIDDTMKDVHDQVKDVNDQVKDVNDQVKAVDAGVKAVEVAVIDGAQHIFNQS